MRNKEYKSVLEHLPEWRATQGGDCVDNGDVCSVLQDMCQCVRREKPRQYRSRLNRLLYSWYMPRNEDDAVYYAVRCRMLAVLSEYVDELLNYLMRLR